MSFQDLERDELYRTAIEDFAVEVHHRAGKDTIIAALEKDGVTWDLYTKANPAAAGIAEDEEEALTETFEEPEDAPVDSAGADELFVADATSSSRHRNHSNVVTSDDVTGKTEQRVRTKKEEINVAANDVWLVHMDRENPYFEFRGESKLHKFTQENPFAVMSAADANAITSTEEGFSIATPAQAQAFYERA